MTEGWGVGPYGGTSWGGSGAMGATDISFYVLRAFAMTSQSIVVVLSAKPTESSPIGTGDALNRDTWVIQDLDTGVALTVLDAAIYSPISNAIQLWTMEEFTGHLDTYRVSTTTLTKDYQAGTIGTPNYADLYGCPVDMAATPADGSPVDIHNPPTPESPAGALSNKSGGDYQLESGEKMFRKVIVRAITWSKDACFHLAGQDFGEGEQLRLNENYSSADILKLKKRTLVQLGRVPEIRDPQVSITLDAQEVLTIYVSATIKATGATVSTALPVNLT